MKELLRTNNVVRLSWAQALLRDAGIDSVVLDHHASLVDGSIGAVLAERPIEEEEALARFGRNLGIAYQLIDDMLDFSARPSEFGKAVGDDFRDGKITLPIVIAFARGDADERAFWRRTLEQGEQGPDDLDRALRLVERHGALVETLARARVYAATAVEALSLFPAGPLRRALAEAATFATERGF